MRGELRFTIPYFRSQGSIVSEQMTTSLKRDLEITLETALMLAGPDTPIPALAATIYDSEPTLMGEVGRIWIIERLTWMLYRRRTNVPSEKQLVLPGFTNLPRRMTLKDGSRPFLMQGTLKDLQEFREVLLKRRPARLRAVERLIELMGEYAKLRAGITVAEVMLAEAAKYKTGGEHGN